LIAVLTGVIWVLTAIAWLSAVILLALARRSHVGALTERALIAVAIALFGTVYSIVIYDSSVTDILPFEAARVLLRAVVVLLLLLPVYWTVLYFTGRLGDGGKG
jgi:hypothetical protein